MSREYAQFWICGPPDEITQRLRLEPSEVQRKQPYDYWRLNRSSDFAEAIGELLSTLETRSAELAAVRTDYPTAGVIIVREVADLSWDNDLVDIDLTDLRRLVALELDLCIRISVRPEHTA